MNRQRMHKYLECSHAVTAALDAGEPVLALESTIISHGMPFPDNLETALAAEQAVRDAGATPATISVMAGRLKAGMTQAELEQLARAGQSALKTSRRDLPFVLASGVMGATTVAATMIVARLAGIRVFATGGIGGVHRGAAASMDISADLEELARTDVAVVCAGPKSVLDIGLTLEYLETRGVAVVGYQTDVLPAFYSRDSGFGVDYRCDTPEAIASILNIRRDLGLAGGTVIANPVPEAHALGHETLEQIITQANQEATGQGVSGKLLTPFLLQRVAELTGNDSLKTNIELVLNNARLGARIAAALSRAS